MSDQTTTPSASETELPPAAPRDPVAGGFKIIVGLAFGAAAWYFFDLHTKQKPSTGAGVVTGIAVGAGLWLILGGVATVRGRRFGWPVGLGVLVACAVAMGMIEPRIIKGQIAAKEQKAWERLQASAKREADYKEYLSWAEEPRAGLSGPMALARAKEGLARLDAVPGLHVDRLRTLLGDVTYPERGDPAESMQPAVALVREALAREYGRAADVLNKRAATAPAKREFPDDPAMRAAFTAVLRNLAKGEDQRVYLAFASENKIGDPAGSEGVIPPGEAFARDREYGRQRSFHGSLTEAITAAFGGDTVIRLKPLESADQRKGRFVFEVSCVTRREPGEFTLTRDGKETGKLMNFAVDWQFAIFGPDGRELARNRSTSTPADSVRLPPHKGGPFWAPYSSLMDSAYYNYCRQIAGRLGLVVPPAQSSFPFQR